MRLDFEGKEDNFTFLNSDELRATIERSTECVKGVKSHLAQGRWSGNMNYSEAMQALTVGDQSLVAQSDQLLAKLEDQLPQTRKWQRINHVTGNRVRIGAFLAGQPNCMRKRKKLERDDAPVTIFMDLTSSAMVDASDLLKRGVAILAFARCLVQHRPVELWGGIALGDGGAWRSTTAWSSTVAWHIDTAPLDLARAAFLLAHPAIARGIGYGIGPTLGGHQSWSGNWPWGNQSLHVRTQQDRMRNALNASEMLVIPPIYGHDPLVRDPETWILRELARLTGKGPEVGTEDWNQKED